MVVIIRLIEKSCVTLIKCRHASTTAINLQQAAIQSSSRVLSKSILLHHFKQQSLSSATDISENETKSELNRPLVVLLTWLNAQEKHIEKYRNLYFQRGFDVLTVKTSPLDLLFPSSGARKIAQNCVTSLEKELRQYPSVILHAFSVGAYQFGEILIEMQRQQQLKDSQNNVDENRKLEKRIKGVVFDSVVPIEELSNGVSRSITSNPFLYKLLMNLINTHLLISTSFATKYYRGASRAVWGNYMRVPALILVSKNDKIGTASANERLTNVWRNLGIDVTFKCWDKSEHVQHLPRHTREYEALIDHFMNKINISNNSIAF